jgi:hypothetical protein
VTFVQVRALTPWPPRVVQNLLERCCLILKRKISQANLPSRSLSESINGWMGGYYFLQLQIRLVKDALSFQTVFFDLQSRLYNPPPPNPLIIQHLMHSEFSIVLVALRRGWFKRLTSTLATPIENATSLPTIFHAKHISSILTHSLYVCEAGE